MRLWHWATFLITFFLLLTILVSKTFLGWGHVNSVLQEGLRKEGVVLGPRQTFNTANLLMERVWDWHIWLGYVLSFLFLFRVIIEFFQPNGTSLTARIKNAVLFLKQRTDRKTARHYLMVKLIYLLFYGLLAAIVGTGLWLAFNRDTTSPDQVHSIKEIHEKCFMLILGFILIHLAGVIWAERRSRQNLVSAMIHGGERSR
jgi:cytochrome b